MRRSIAIAALIACAHIARGDATDTLDVDTASDIVDGTTTSVTNLNAAKGADGKVSLREALIATNATSGTNTIFVNLGAGLTFQPSLISGAFTTLTRSNVSISSNGTPTVSGQNVFTGLNITAAANISITGVNFDGCGTGVTMSNTNGGSITGCKFGTVSGNGFGNLNLSNCSNYTVGGAAAAARNIVVRNLSGITLVNCSACTIQGNVIGTDAAGTAGLGCQTGILVDASANCIVANNVVASSGTLSNGGIFLTHAGATGTQIHDNVLGFAPDGVSVRANGTGIRIDLGAHGNMIGAGNIVANSTGVGVLVDGAATNQNTISQNSIFNNATTGIRLSNGANGGIAAPVVTATTPVVSGTAPANSTVQIFADSGSQGKTYLETVAADPSGNWTGTQDLTIGPHEGKNATATATLAASGTSQFSAGVALPQTPPSVSGVTLNDPVFPVDPPTLSFAVNFSENVIGIETGAGPSDDFTLIDSTGGAAITNVAGSGASYTVTLTPGPSDGTIALQVGGGTITDLSGAPLTPATFTSAIYTLDHLFVANVTLDNPVVSELTSVAFTVNFNKAVTGVETGAGPTDDFTLVDTTGGATITNIAGGGATYNVQVQCGPNDGTIALQVNGATISDSLGGSLSNAPFTSSAYTIDHLFVTSITLDDGAAPTNQQNLGFTVNFNKAVTGVETGPGHSNDFTLIDGTGGASVASVSGASATYQVTVQPGPNNGSIALQVSGATISDAAGGTLNPGTFTSAPYTVQHLRITDDLPAAISAIEHDDVTLSVAYEGPLTPTFEWFRELGAKTFQSFGPDAPSVTLSDVSITDRGRYYVQLLDGNEARTSQICTLDVIPQIPAAGLAGLALLAAALGVGLRRRR